MLFFIFGETQLNKHGQYDLTSRKNTDCRQINNTIYLNNNNNKLI